MGLQLADTGCSGPYNTLQRLPVTHCQASLLQVTGGQPLHGETCPASHCLACGCLQLLLKCCPAARQVCF